MRHNIPSRQRKPVKPVSYFLHPKRFIIKVLMVTIVFNLINMMTVTVDKIYAQSAVMLIRPVENEMVYANKPEMECRILVPYDKASLYIEFDYTYMTALAKITETGFTLRPVQVVAPGEHTLKITFTDENKEEFAEVYRFTTRHSKTFEQAYSKNNISAVYTNILKRSDDAKTKQLSDWTLESNIGSRNILSEGPWELGFNTNLRYFNQELPVEEPLEKGLDLIDYVLTGKYKKEAYSFNAAVGDVTIDETRNTVNGLSRRGGTIGTELGPLYFSGFVVRSDKVKLGAVEFSKNLSSCFDGCSTGFKKVLAGKNQVFVQFTGTSPWKRIGTLGKFEKCSHYAVNIFMKGKSLCATLALRQQTDSTYNNDRTKRMLNKTCTRLRKKELAPSASRRITPKMVKQNKKAILQFPVTVKNLVVRDYKNKIVQSFKKGKQFDITKSVKKNGGKDLKLSYIRADALGIKQGAKPGHMVPVEKETTFLLPTRLLFKSILEGLRNIDSKEPENNTINGAVAVISGNLTGEVGGDDPADYFKLNPGGSGYGRYIKVTRTSGNVNLHLYGPAKNYHDWNHDSVWIAVVPGASIYVQVEPASTISTEYELRAEITPVVDNMEPNETFSQAKTYDSPGNKVLCNLFNLAGDYVDVRDYYKFNLTEEKLIRINVDDAGLDSGQTVSISLYDKDNVHKTTETGNTNGGTLEYDVRGLYSATHPPFPAGDWRILVTTHTETEARAYGTGDGPECYTNATGYSLTLELID